ncbi:MAG TPA: O-methyltransferase [Roseiarcus sp.]|nr:O-methyltransferase [Roseiarcus sp.]
MSERGWRAVDAYFDETIVGRDSVLEATLSANAAARLPSIDVSAAQGKMLTLMARMAGARMALEIGTLGGYSTICIARALLPAGRLVTIEALERHANVARANIARAGLADRVDLRVGAALDVLPAIEAEGLGPFDFVFIDADKSNNTKYVEWALRLSRPGTAIIVDNVVRDGRIADALSTDSDVTGTRRMFEMMAQEPRLAATAVQTVGAKGWDGFALAIVE